jgi:hypothetical protein
VREWCINTAAVNPATNSVFTPKDGNRTLGSSTLNTSGQATFSVSNLNKSNHSITAVYGGITNFLTSTSPVLTQTVN